MVELSPEQLAQRASDLNLVDRRQLESVWGELGTNVSLVDMQRVLLGRGILTNYQFDRLARGEARCRSLRRYVVPEGHRGSSPIAGETFVEAMQAVAGLATNWSVPVR